MVVEFKTISAISAYHHKRCEFKSHSWRDVRDTTLCDKFGRSVVFSWYSGLLHQ